MGGHLPGSFFDNRRFPCDRNFLSPGSWEPTVPITHHLHYSGFLYHETVAGRGNASTGMEARSSETSSCKSHERGLSSLCAPKKGYMMSLKTKPSSKEIIIVIKP